MNCVITPDTVVVQGDEQVATELDGEVIALGTVRNAYYAMGETGSVLWGFASSPVTVAAMAEHLCGTYDVAPERCLADATVFVQECVEDGLLRVVGP